MLPEPNGGFIGPASNFCSAVARKPTPCAASSAKRRRACSNCRPLEDEPNECGADTILRRGEQVALTLHSSCETTDSMRRRVPRSPARFNDSTRGREAHPSSTSPSSRRSRLRAGRRRRGARRRRCSIGGSAPGHWGKAEITESPLCSHPERELSDLSAARIDVDAVEVVRRQAQG